MIRADDAVMRIELVDSVQAIKVLGIQWSVVWFLQKARLVRAFLITHFESIDIWCEDLQIPYHRA